LKEWLGPLIVALKRLVVGGFNSLPGHHVFNKLAKIAKPWWNEKTPFIVGGNPALRANLKRLIFLAMIDLQPGE